MALAVAPMLAAAAPAPKTICGITAASVAEFERAVRRDPLLRPVSTGATWVAWRGPTQIWAVTRPGHAAHPTISCTDARRGSAGRWRIGGGYFCEASAGICAAEARQFAEEQRMIAENPARQ